MRIAHLVSVLIAVLSLAAALFPCCSALIPLAAGLLVPPGDASQPHDTESTYSDHIEEPGSGLHRGARSVADRYRNSTIRSPANRYNIAKNYRQVQRIMREENNGKLKAIDCCPSVEEMVEPEGGSDPDGLFVHLYNDSDTRQRFYEHSCRPDVVGKPCRFVNRSLYNHTRCVQKYSYSYALIRDPAAEINMEARHHHHQPKTMQPHLMAFPHNHKSKFMLGYIKVRSGCSCEVFPHKDTEDTPPKTKRKLKKKLNKKNEI